MENYELHPDINNKELVMAREMAEKVLSGIELKIGQLTSFIEDPSAEESEKEKVSEEIESLKEKLAEATLLKTSLDQQYDEEVAQKIQEIENELEQAA